MFDVHEQQLLMLLLVMEPQHDQFGHLLRHWLNQQFEHGCIDMSAVFSNLVDGWSGDQASLGSGMSRADSFVVRVEQEAVHLVEFDVRGMKGFEQKSLKEPGDVRTVPLRWAGVRHGLHNLIFSAQHRCQGFGVGSDFLVPISEFRRRSTR